MFAAKWKKEALLLLKGAKKFVDYKRDLLTPDRIAEIESRKVDLVNAIASKDVKQVDEASKQMRSVCENALPKQAEPGWLEENVEVIFVAIVIALGLRAYYLQPFRIPTGSMQPTLNGIIGTPLAEDKWPSLPTRLLEFALRGRSYIKVVAENDMTIALGLGSDGKYRTDIRDSQYLHFFSHSQLRTQDGSLIEMPAPAGPMYEIGLDKAAQAASRNKGFIPKGTVLAEGTIDTGDLVLVDKFTYHFRQPKRGEVFVFNTIGIEGTKKNTGKTGALKEQEDATHYIKRLAAVPGDTLSISPPHVLIDGKIAHETGFENVYTLPLHGRPGVKGYSFASLGSSNYPPLLVTQSDSIHLQKENARPGMREYCALGDNSGNSLDSRYWGTVKEFNVVGPALFSLWPITTGHWGFIR